MIFIGTDKMLTNSCLVTFSSFLSFLKVGESLAHLQAVSVLPKSHSSFSTVTLNVALLLSLQHSEQPLLTPFLSIN